MRRGVRRTTWFRIGGVVVGSAAAESRPETAFPPLRPRFRAVAWPLAPFGHDVAGDGEEGAMDLVPGRGAIDSPGRFSRCVVLPAFAAALGRW